jgi:hypothetical protein
MKLVRLTIKWLINNYMSIRKRGWLIKITKLTHSFGWFNLKGIGSREICVKPLKVFMLSTKRWSYSIRRRKRAFLQICDGHLSFFKTVIRKVINTVSLLP